MAFPFSEGLALVCRDRQHYQYITPTGEVVITLKRGNGYQAQPFSEGLAAVCCDYEWGFIDKTGEWVIKPVYQRAMGLAKGLVRFVFLIGKGKSQNLAEQKLAEQHICKNERRLL